MKDDYYYQFSLHHLYISLLKGWENVLFQLGSERINVSPSGLVPLVPYSVYSFSVLFTLCGILIFYHRATSFRLMISQGCNRIFLPRPMSRINQEAFFPSRYGYYIHTKKSEAVRVNSKQTQNWWAVAPLWAEENPPERVQYWYQLQTSEIRSILGISPRRVVFSSPADLLYGESWIIFPSSL